MDRRKKTVVWVVALLLIFMAVVSFWLRHEFSDLCGNEIYQEAYSPKNKYKAIIFQRDCGATTGFSTQISIISASESLKNDSGNIYVAKGKPDQTNLRLEWASDDALIIVNHNSTAHRKENKVDGVSVIYK